MSRLNLPLQSSRRTSAERLVNCYAEEKPPDDKGRVAVRRAPGISLIADAERPGRGIFQSRGQVYVCAGDTLFRLLPNNELQPYGTIAGSGRVQFAETTNGIALVAEPTLYVAEGGAAQPVSDPDLPPVSGCAGIDNVLVVSERGTGRFYASPVGQPTSFDALDFATAEANADPILSNGLVDFGRLLFVPGSQTIELWANTGEGSFSFERVGNGVIKPGCHAGATVALVNGVPYWLSEDLTVRALSGYASAKISTSGVDDAIANLSYTRDAFAVPITYSGHLWYVLTFPTAKATFVYDATTRLWHERETFGLGWWDVVGATSLDGRVYLLSSSGRVGVLTRGLFQEFGGPQRMRWQYPSVYADGEHAFHDALEVALRVDGVPATGQGSDPQLLLAVSDDGGRAFDACDAQSLGRVGERTKVLRFTQLGMSADRSYRCDVSDPVDVTVLATVLTASGGYVR